MGDRLGFGWRFAITDRMSCMATFTAIVTITVAVTSTVRVRARVRGLGLGLGLGENIVNDLGIEVKTRVRNRRSLRVRQ